MSDPPVVLIHGGLYEPMDAARFWAASGVVASLEEAGFAVLAPNRVPRPESWGQEADHIAGLLQRAEITGAAVVAGSNGCSVGARLAVDHPELVGTLVLCWPATQGDEEIDRMVTPALRAQGVTERVIAGLLEGETLRGVADEELRTLPIPTALIPSDPANPFHQRRTVDTLTALIPGVIVAPGCPEAPHARFDPGRFVASLTEILRDLPA